MVLFALDAAGGLCHGERKASENRDNHEEYAFSRQIQTGTDRISAGKGHRDSPLLLLMDWLFHMYGIFFAATVTTVLSAVAALIFCYKDYRKELKEIKEG